MSTNKKPLSESDSQILRKYANILNESEITEAPKAQSLNPEDYGSWKEYAAVLKMTPTQVISKYMDNYKTGGQTIIFPSRWLDGTEDLGWGNIPYPGKLAEALVNSAQNESITDLGNIYYNHRNYSPEATSIFRQDALRTGKNLLCEFGMVNLLGLVKAEPKLMKQIILTMSPQEFKQFEEATDSYDGMGTLDNLLRGLGIKR